MIEALAGEGRIVAGLGEHEGALQHALCVTRQARGAPTARKAVLRHRRADIRFERRGVAEYGLAAGLADRRRDIVDLLRHRPDEAAEFGDLSHDHRLAESDIGQQPVTRVVGIVIGRCGEKRAGKLYPPLGRGHAQRLLRLEVMEIGALGHRRGPAEIVYRGRCKAALADKAERRVEQPRAGVSKFGILFRRSWHKNTYRTDGMYGKRKV